MPDYTAQVDALGTLRFLDAIRETGLNETKFYQASTSELYGKVQEVPQTEKTPFYPRSPYAVAKLYAYWIIVNYREAYDLFACNGILFNHESPRRGETFVTRKITRAATSILLGIQEKLILGNLNAKRDWGYAPEYCEGMWQMLQQEKPDDFVLATGETNTVRDFVSMTFNELGIELEWLGEEEGEMGVVKSFKPESVEFLAEHKEHFAELKEGDVLVEVSPNYYRPTEVELLIGDPTKAKTELDWEVKTKLPDLVKLMTRSDFEQILRRGY